MRYDFANLSSREFEHLARDLVGREIGLRFEAFGVGPDGGMDGRHVQTNGETTILQAKHYRDFKPLLTTMSNERRTIDRLQPHRYILVTSTTLNEKRKFSLSTEIGPHLRSIGDIFGRDDLNDLLIRYPDIEKAHNSLWRSSTSVLEEILQNVVLKALGSSGEHPPRTNLNPGRDGNEGTDWCGDALAPLEPCEAASVSEILSWGDSPDHCVEHIENAVSPNGNLNINLRFQRRVSTMHPDEIIFVRVIWLLCKLQQIEWRHFQKCARVVCICSDAEVLRGPGPVTSEAEIQRAASKLIRSISSYERGKHYAGFKEAVIATSEHAEEGPLREYLRGQADSFIS